MLRQIKYALTVAMASLVLALSPLTVNAEHDHKQGCCAQKAEKGCCAKKGEKGCCAGEDKKGCCATEDKKGCCADKDKKGCCMGEDKKGCCMGKHAEKPQANKFQHGQGRSLHQQWCVRCHGSITGDGLTGPNLTKSVAALSKEEFIDIVTNGKNVGNGVMPSWNKNPRVMSGMEKLYGFLLANSESGS